MLVNSPNTSPTNFLIFSSLIFPATPITKLDFWNAILWKEIKSFLFILLSEEIEPFVVFENLWFLKKFSGWDLIINPNVRKIWNV